MSHAEMLAERPADTGMPLWPDEPAIEVSEWLPGEAPRQLSVEEAASAKGTLCFLVDNRCDPESVYRQLQPLCGTHLEQQMIDDLMAPDDLPRVNEYGGAIRKVSAFGARAEQSPDGRGAGQLVFGLVEFLANEEWLIVCCHESSSFAGAERCTLTAGEGCGWLVDAAENRWRKESFSSAGDLGILMLYQLTCTYSKTRRTLLAWLEHWELQWYREGDADQETLVSLRGLAAEFRARLNALNQPRDDAADGWFTHVENEAVAERADRHIDRSLEALDRLSDMLRSSFELLHTQRTAEQLHLQRIQADRTDRLQEKIEKITSIFLVPTLVAGFFGANTALPGRNDPASWMSFEIMVATMIVGGLAAYFGLAWFRERERRLIDAADTSRAPDAEVRAAP